MSETIVDGKGLEFSFLQSWNGWDELDMTVLQFYHAVVRDDIGFPEHLKAEVDCMVLDMKTSKVEFYNEPGDVIFSSKIVASFANK